LDRLTKETAKIQDRAFTGGFATDSAMPPGFGAGSAAMFQNEVVVTPRRPDAPRIRPQIKLDTERRVKLDE
jgi:hypothetical protein